MNATPAALSRRKLIIGFGDPLHGDDAPGWEVASRLAASLDDQRIDIRLTTQLSPDLLEPISEAELVIFIDATRQGPLGDWACEEIFPGSEVHTSPRHGAELKRLLEWSRQLFRTRPRALLVSVTAATFALGEQVTRTADEVVPQVVEFIRAQVTAEPVYARCAVD